MNPSPRTRRAAAHLEAIFACTLVALSACTAPAPEPESRPSTSDVAEAIRAADQEEVRAILHGDPETQASVWAPDFVVTNTEGQVLYRDEILRVFESGVVPYDSFERTTEEVRDLGHVAVSLGSERVVPAGGSPVRAVERRYTHVWVHRDDRWRLSVRHAVTVEP